MDSGSSTTAQMSLKDVCRLAMEPGVITLFQTLSSIPSSYRINIATKISISCEMFRQTCITPVRFASALAPMEHTMAVVTASPRYIPSIMGYTAEYTSVPVMDIACNIPTVADEDWRTNATAKPTRKPSTGLSEKRTIQP